jgi:hypothetical protein
VRARAEACTSHRLSQMPLESLPRGRAL